MTLNLIGLGLDEKSITLKGLEKVKNSDYVYLESYTSKFNSDISNLEKIYGKKIILANRTLVENSYEIVERAKNNEVSFLVIGDVFCATTHLDIFLRAKKMDIKINVVNNASILNAASITGLDMYKFGRTTSIVFPDNNWYPKTPYTAIKNNLSIGLHTLCLLDIKVSEPSLENLKKGIDTPEKPRFMNVQEGLNVLLKLEEEHKENIISENTWVLGVARLGQNDEVVKYGKLKDLKKIDFGKELHSIIVPYNPNEIEQEMLDYHNIY